MPGNSPSPGPSAPGGTPPPTAPRITAPHITVYTSAMCGYCVAAKNFLKSRGLAWDEVRVDLDPAEREHMIARSGGKYTVPQIFVGDVHVGGYDDMMAMHRAGRLAPLLAGEGA